MNRPLILVTNDDGFQAEGLWAAVEAVLSLGEVVVVAPDRQWSGAGRSMPYDVTGRVVSTRLELDGQIVSAHAVDGSPALAVQHGLLELAPRWPALVVSGINSGANLGTEVTISGTVGAALEAAAFGIPALAVSLEMDPAYHLTRNAMADYTAAGAFTHDFAQRLLASTLPDDVHALSINVPQDATPETPWRMTHLSRCRYFWPTAPDRNIVLEVVRWETHVHPGIGEDPQAVINRQIESYDIFVGIFWHRVGTKTQRAESGTIEEFEMARDLNQQGRLKHLLLYFKTTRWMPSTEDEAEQMRRLLAFRKSISGSALVKEFKTTRAFEQTLRTDLSNVLKNWVSAQSGSTATTGLPFTAIVAREVPAVAEAAVRLVPGNALPHKVISGGHYSPLSVRWTSDTEVAFATRGGDVMVAAAGMEPRPIDLGGAVPSYVTAHGNRVATVKYTYLSLCSLEGRPAGSRSIILS